MYISRVILFLLFSIVRSVTPYPLPLTWYDNLQNGLDERSVVDLLDSNSSKNNAKMDDSGLNKAADSVNVAHPPNSLGLFRDPLEILGPKFPAQETLNLCRVNLIQDADIVSEVIFPDNGKRLCQKVCKQYQERIFLDGPTDVSYLEGYCDYTGIVDFSGVSVSDRDYDLSTQCTCAYKIRCNQKTNVIMYTFQPNSAGYLKVLFTESYKKHSIT